jgi:T4 RnlA family RNA ligase
MNYFIPTYNEAVRMTGGTEDLFYSSETIIDGYKIVVFNYRLAQYNDFINPPGDVRNAFEMRGLTYVFNTDGTLYERYLLLDKFFNLNQVPSTLYSEVKDLKINNIYSKEDGSVITFIKLPNGKVIAKTKMSFEADQAKGANLVYSENNKLENFINWTLENDITAIFEYVAPDNRIVLKYYERDLILLRLRDNKTGEYLNLDDFKEKLEGIKLASKYEFTLNELIELAKSESDVEGWVVQFEGGKMIKIKTEWYFTLHGLITEDIHRENLLIGHILDENIDDILSKIEVDDIETIDRINYITEVVQKWIKLRMSSINNTYIIYEKLSRKEFALSYRKDKDFPFVMAKVNGRDLYGELVKYLKKVTYRLESARSWLESAEKEVF